MRLLFSVFFSLLVGLAKGQQAKIDSLQQLIDKTEDSERKVKLLNELSFTYFATNVEKGDAPTLQALQVARKVGDKKGEAWAMAYRGVYFLLNGILPEAKKTFEQSEALSKKVNDKNLQSYSLSQLGDTYLDKGIFDSAYLYYKKSLLVSQKNTTPQYRSMVIMNLARYYLVIHQPDSAIQSAQEALQLRTSQKDAVSLADSWMLIGNCYLALDDFNEAEKYFQKAYSAAPHDPIVQTDHLQNMGEIYFRRGDFQHAMRNWNEVLSYHRVFQYKYVLAELLFRMGAVFEEQGYFDLSIEYLTNALTLSEKSNYQFLTGKIYNELGWVYYRSRNFEFALKYNQTSEKILKQLNAKLEVAGCWDLRGLIERNLKHNDTALYYHEKSLAARMPLNNKAELSDGYFNLGEFHMKMGRPKIALPYYFKSLAIDKNLGSQYGISLSSNRIGHIYTLLGRLDSAKIYLDKSLALAIPISSNDIFKDDYLDLANYFETLGKSEKAIPYYKKYIQLTDSIFSIQSAQSLASYRTLYDVERNEKKIELLNKDNELSNAQLQKQKIILYSGAVSLTVLLLLAGSYYRFNKRLKKLNHVLEEKNEEIKSQSEGLVKANEALSKSNREIAEQKEEIQTQAEELVESNHTISSINDSLEEKIEARTAELKQAYKELDTFFYRSSHDFRRPLTTFMGLAEVAKITVKDNAALELFEKVNTTARQLDKMLMKLQSISDLGVQELIYKEVSIKEMFNHCLRLIDKEILQKNIHTWVEVEAGLSFHSYPALIKILVENLLENAVSFSRPDDPTIKLKAYKNQGEVVIEVEDNGQGIEKEYIDRVFEMYFRANESSKGNGLGLYIVKKTADKLNARIDLQSEANEGTKISVFFPLAMNMVQPVG